MDSEQNKENKKQTQLNWWFILIVSIFPPTILAVVFCKKAREIVKLTPDSLDKQNLFWIAILLPIFSFVLFGIVAWYGTELDGSWQGYNKFLEISKLPLGILAFSPIFGVFVSNIHRTIQTKEQIERTEDQIKITKLKNNFDSFNSHMKIICDELKEFKVEFLSCEYTIKSRMKLYRDIFKKSSVLVGANNSISNNFIIELDKLYGNLYKHSTSYLMNFHINSDETIIRYVGNETRINKIIYDIHDSIIYLFEHFGLEQENYKYLDFTYDYDKDENYHQLNIMHNIWEALREIDKFIEKLLYSIGYDFSIENEFTQNFYGKYMIRKQLGQASVKYDKDVKWRDYHQLNKCL
nr:hypothetical protein [Providencia rettgeri]